MALLLVLLTLFPINRTVETKDFKFVKLSCGVGAARLIIEPQFGSLLVFDGEYPGDIFDSLAFNVDTIGDTLKIDIETHLKEKIEKLKERGSVILRLPGNPIIDLELDMGVSKADIELGGLKLVNAKLSGGVSKLRLSFGETSNYTGDSLLLALGVSKFKIKRLGNSGFKYIKIEAGVASLDIDLRGKWKEVAVLDISSAISSLTISYPHNLGIKLKSEGILNLKDIEGFEKKDDIYITPGYERMKKKLIINLEGAFNLIDFERIGADI